MTGEICPAIAILLPFLAGIRFKPKTPEGFTSFRPCTDTSWRINLASAGFE